MVTDPEIISALAQFGVAGLIGWMWLSERRSAAGRERHLDEAHERIRGDRLAIDALVQLVRENTRALSGVEHQQRELCAAIERLNRTLDAARRETRRHGSAA